MLNGDNAFSETAVSGVGAVIEPKSWYDRSVPRHLRKATCSMFAWNLGSYYFTVRVWKASYIQTHRPRPNRERAVVKYKN